MKLHTPLPSVALLLVALCALSPAQQPDSAIFPLPDILKPNVTFWTRIYTEVSESEGLLHDRDYPSVVYRKVTMSEPSGKRRSAMLTAERDSVVALVQAVVTQPESTWTPAQRGAAEILRASVPPDAWGGAPERVRFQQGQKERFLQGLQRSGRYIDTIRAIFAQYGIPERIAYLPHVESSFNTEAYSKVGAAGLWQFMRGTGKLFMDVGYLVDQRRDPFVATVGAAKLLRQNYDELGAWPLAITAYNHGLNGMKRAVATTGSRDIAAIIAKHESRSFQFASKNFYGCFLAASSIAQNPTPYFGTVKYEPRLRVSEIALDRYMTPRVLSKYTGVSQDVLMDLNPALRPVVFTSQHQIPAGYRLRLPPGKVVDSVQVALAAVPDSLAAAEPRGEKYYKVQRGDNLYGIASRLGVAAEALLSANNIDRRDRIYAGQVLTVPTATATVVAVVAASTPPAAAIEEAEQQITEVAVVPPPVVDTSAARKPVTPEPVKPPPPKPPVARPVVVADSLREVVMKPALVLPDSPSTARPSVSPNFDVEVYNLDASLSATGDMAGIFVSVDETMGHYSEWMGIPTQRIRDLNGMRGSDIRINGKLMVPIGKYGFAHFVAARLEYHMALEEDFYSQYRVSEVRSRPLKRGEALWDICNGEEQIPLWLFKKYNKHLDLGKLIPGIEIWIPIVAEGKGENQQPPSIRAAPTAPYRDPARPVTAPVRRTP
jgi:membrane-bound lytic murein transglycosylase D